MKEREAERERCVLKIVSKVGTPSIVCTTRKFKRIKQTLPLTPKGSETGPNRTPSHFGNSWQSTTDYEVEKLGKRAIFRNCLIIILDVDIDSFV